MLKSVFPVSPFAPHSSLMQLWEKEQGQLLSDGSAQPLSLSGDGRCDSPGFCAKYLTYTLTDARRDVILHTELVQVTEVGNSVRMELEGLKRGSEFLLRNSCSIERIVTDRHSSIRAFLRREYPSVLHLFDCWHMAKGVKKKLLAASKCRGLEVLASWVKAIVNHMYWSAASSDGHPELILPKWCSLTNHIVNIHEHEFPLFPVCSHGDLAEEQRVWLNEGT